MFKGEKMSHVFAIVKKKKVPTVHTLKMSSHERDPEGIPTYPAVRLHFEGLQGHMICNDLRVKRKQLIHKARMKSFYKQCFKKHCRKYCHNIPALMQHENNQQMCYQSCSDPLLPIHTSIQTTGNNSEYK